MFRKKLSRVQKRRVKNRDNNKCVLCWVKYRLAVHHHWDHTGALSTDKYKSNDPYNKPRDCQLVTLCNNCNSKIQVTIKGSPIYQLVTDYLIEIRKKSLFKENSEQAEKKKNVS